MIANDPYLKFWNDSIIQNASRTLSDEPEKYQEDGGLGGSGVLDVARRIKMKVKNWSYAYRITNETKYADRVFLELQVSLRFIRSGICQRCRSLVNVASLTLADCCRKQLRQPFRCE